MENFDFQSQRYLLLLFNKEKVLTSHLNNIEKKVEITERTFFYFSKKKKRVKNLNEKLISNH